MYAFIIIDFSKEVLLSKDENGQTFFHHAAAHGSVNMVQQINTKLSKESAKLLRRTQDKNDKRAEALTDGLKSDYVNQVGAGVQEFYLLETAPKVLIFYSTKDRQDPEKKFGAEEEKTCLENYFTKKKFICVIKKDPRIEEMLSAIAEVRDDSNLSGLIVFIMSHGGKGYIEIEGGRGYITVQEIMNHMCENTAGKPKVNQS